MTDIGLLQRSTHSFEVSAPFLIKLRLLKTNERTDVNFPFCRYKNLFLLLLLARFFLASYQRLENVFFIGSANDNEADNDYYVLIAFASLFAFALTRKCENTRSIFNSLRASKNIVKIFKTN